MMWGYFCSWCEDRKEGLFFESQFRIFPGCWTLDLHPAFELIHGLIYAKPFADNQIEPSLGQDTFEKGMA
jgi:hypothetical protein